MTLRRLQFLSVLILPFTLVGLYISLHFVPKLCKPISGRDRVSLDYLVGNTDMELDKTVIDRVVEIQSLPDEDKSPILYTLDNLLQNARTKKAFAK